MFGSIDLDTKNGDLLIGEITVKQLTVDALNDEIRLDGTVILRNLIITNKDEKVEIEFVR